jgi:hypothetical protein
VDWNVNKKKWLPDHSVRRFIRPVLMRDPQPEKDLAELTNNSEVAADPAIAPALETLSDQRSEEMKRVRDTVNALSSAERAVMVEILEAVPDPAEKAQVLYDLSNKYHDDKLTPNLPPERRDLINRLRADLVIVQRRSQSVSKSRKTK